MPSAHREAWAASDVSNWLCWSWFLLEPSRCAGSRGANSGCLGLSGMCLLKTRTGLLQKLFFLKSRPPPQNLVPVRVTAKAVDDGLVSQFEVVVVLWSPLFE